MIRKVVLTGGPGSGKTTILNYIKEHFKDSGKKLLVVNETATDMINSGVKCFGEDNIDILDFQELVLKLQLSKEDIYDKAAYMYSKKYPLENILIIYDRGTIDNRAFITDEQFKNLLSNVSNCNCLDLLNNYDLVIDLVSSTEFYTTSNNSARSEDVETALSLGVRILKCWEGHPKLKIVLPKETITEKVEEVINYLDDLMKEKQQKQQKKFLVDLNKSDLDYIFNIGSSFNIEQTYLLSVNDEERRLRKISVFNDLFYNLSIYKVLNEETKILVTNKKVDEDTYNELLKFKIPDKKTLVKKRVYFDYNGIYMYIDIFYDNGKIEDVGFLELDGDFKNYVIPSFLSIIRDVSKNPKYNNFNKASEKSLVLKKSCSH